MCPAVQFQHLDIVQTFTCCVDASVLFFHKYFLKFCLNASKTHICDKSKNENCNSSKKAFTEISEQNYEANDQQKW